MREPNNDKGDDDIELGRLGLHVRLTPPWSADTYARIVDLADESEGE